MASMPTAAFDWFKLFGVSCAYAFVVVVNVVVGYGGQTKQQLSEAGTACDYRPQTWQPQTVQAGIEGDYWQDGARDSDYAGEFADDDEDL